MIPDFVIVGGGTAGCILAARLTEDPSCSVVLVEAGPDIASVTDLPASLSGVELPERRYLWSYENMLTASRQGEPQVRGRVMGGSSAVNGAVFLRGFPEDYDSWGSDAWDFASLLPFMKKLETDRDFHDDYHGHDGPVPIARRPRDRWSSFAAAFYEASVALGYPEKPDLNNPLGSGVGPVPKNDPDGVRMSTALTHLATARGRKNLSIRSDSIVQQVRFERKRAVGVNGRRGGTPFSLDAGEIILSAGAIGSPHLLLLSGVGPNEELRRLGISTRADVPGVGQNLRCHPSVRARITSSYRANRRPGSPSTYEVLLQYTAPGSTDRNDMMLLPLETADATLINACVRLPASRGELRLRSIDPAVTPLLDYGYLDPWDGLRLRSAVRSVADLLDQPAMRGLSARFSDLTPEELASDDALDGRIIESLSTPQHACGTCKLGPPSDDAAVVDDRCRVRGVEGLRVIDLSIVPQSVRSGPHATVGMIGERAADLIRHGRGS